MTVGTVNPNAGIGIWPSIAEGSSKVVSKTEGVERLSKVIRAIARFALATFAVTSELCKSLVERFSTVADFCGALNIVNRIYEWTCVTFKTSQKFASRVFLTASNAVETFLWLGKVGLYNLGKIAAAAGPLAGVLGAVFKFLPFVKDGFAAVAFGLSIWNSGIEISDAKGDIVKVKEKLKKWVDKKLDHDAIPDTAKATENTKLVEKFEAKIAKLAANELPAKTKDWKKEVQEEYKLARIKNLERFIAEIKDGKADALEVNRKYKVDLYSARIEGKKTEMTKSWLTIASDVLKIAIITFGTVLALTNLASVGVLIAIAALGLVVDSFGGFKFIWDECIFKKPVEPTKPVFVGTAAAAA